DDFLDDNFAHSQSLHGDYSGQPAERQALFPAA
ncbi:unnamed protein product, partial [marine sediment metagenome]